MFTEILIDQILQVIQPEFSMAVRGSNLSRKAELLTVQAIKSLGTDFIQVTKKFFILYFLLNFLAVLALFTFVF